MLIRMTALVLCCAAAGFAQVAQVADAVRQQDQLALRHLLQAKADVNAALVDGSTALHWAVENDDADTVEMLLKVRRDRECQGSLRLHRALLCRFEWERARFVQKLLKAGANPNIANKVGRHGFDGCGAIRQGGRARGAAGA